METRKLTQTKIVVAQPDKVYDYNELISRKNKLEEYITLYVSLLPQKIELNEINLLLSECTKLDVTAEELPIKEELAIDGKII